MPQKRLVRKLQSGEIQVEKKLRTWEFSSWSGVGKQYENSFVEPPVLMIFRPQN